MKMNIVREKSNPYLKRKELVLNIEHSAESTPSKLAIQELLAKQLSADKEKIEIVDIISETGLPKSKSNVLIWEEVPKKKEKKTEKPEEQKEEKKEVKPEAKAEGKEIKETKKEETKEEKIEKKEEAKSE